MERSESLTALAKSLIAFQKKSKTIGFDKTNPYFKSKYATLTALVEGTKKDLAECGLAVSQLLDGDGSVTTMLIDASGEYLSSTIKLNPTKPDPQGVGSAVSYARRYAYASILGLVSDEDDDGNEASKPKKETHLESGVTPPIESNTDIRTVSFIPSDIKYVKSKSSGNYYHKIFDQEGVSYMCNEAGMAAVAVEAHKQEKMITLEYKQLQYGLGVVSLFLTEVKV